VPEVDKTYSVYLKEVSAAVEFAEIHSVRDVLEHLGVCSRLEFDAWKHQRFWDYVLKEALGQEGLLWFDLVLFNPLTGKYDYSAVYCGESGSQEDAGFRVVQRVADRGYYRTKVFSLSRLFVEGVAASSGRTPISITRQLGELAVRNPADQLFFQLDISHQDQGYRKLANEESVEMAVEELGSAFEKVHGFENVCDELGRATQVASGGVLSAIDSRGLARYLAWLALLPTWTSYVYIPLPSFSRKTGSVVFAFKSGVGELALQSFYERIQNGILVLAMTISQIAENSIAELARDAATAAIMSRNMSHNIGSHVLVGLDQHLIAKNAEETSRLVSYLQQRMDFVARVATEWPAWREPVFFMRGLLRGFFRQYLLLDRLVKDDNYYAEDITFEVHGPFDSDSEWATYRLSAEPGQSDKDPPVQAFLASEGDDTRDFLVAIPGGTVGMHAFYGLLENAIRNAAKHNAKRSSLVIHISVRESDGDRGFFEARYWDNLTDGTAVVKRVGGRPDDHAGPMIEEVSRERDIAERIDQLLIDPATGKLTKQNWGIQEMKVCASFLACEGSKRPTGEKALKVSLVGDPDVGGNSTSLGYSFGLRRAVLVAISAAQPLSEETAPWLNRFGIELLENCCGQLDRDGVSISRVRDLSPGLLFHRLPECPVGARQEVGALCDWIKRHELKLPARILVGASDPEWLKAELRARGLSDRVCATKFLPLPAEPSGAEQWIVSAYATWLTAFAREQGCEAPFRLVVALKRPDPNELAGLERLQSDVARFGLGNLLEAYLLYFPKKADLGPSEVSWHAWRPRVGHGFADWFRHLEPQGGSWLLFDNHRSVSSELKTEDWKRIRFYQHTGRYSDTGEGPNNYTMFERLANIPGEFCGVMSLLQIVEACLMRLLVVDERLLGAALALKQGPADRECRLGIREDGLSLTDLTRAGVAITPFFRKDGDVISLLPASCKIVPVDQGTDKASYPGLTLDSAGRIIGLSVVDMGRRGLTSLDLSQSHRSYDAAIIHWGQIEKLQKQWHVDTETLLRDLGIFATRVVVTSGRGKPRDPTVMGFPFVEFSVLENYLIREMAKGPLCNVLMNVF
jgi:hypothetical protein